MSTQAEYDARPSLKYVDSPYVHGLETKTALLLGTLQVTVNDHYPS